MTTSLHTVPTITPTAARVALVAALGAAGLWAAKAVAIGLAGGLDRSPAEDPLFFTGLLCALTSAFALTLDLTRGRATWLRATALVAVVPVVGVVVGVTDAAVRALAPDDSWVWSEASLWLTAAVLVLAATRRAQRG